GTPAPRPSATPGPLRGAADQLRGVVRPIPGAGPVADEVIDETVDQVEPTPAPPPPPRRR
ncbi:MAG: signal recognition particle-docking protein FtsY, partial [Actinomycetota bacterium]|nr:signal recognition particle-docking protein FtsY [Actinomycetota bacterium]